MPIRPTPERVSSVERPVPLRIAEARAQFSLGNVALALETFRKALRDDPRSIDAQAGIAACYDRMARFDLSRRHYEAALALAPADAQLLESFAASLARQGLATEAQSVRQEIAIRAEAAASDVSAAAQVLEPAITADAGVSAKATSAVPQASSFAPAASSSVTVKLPPARTQLTSQAAAIVSSGTPSATAQTVAHRHEGPRLERLAPGEVALVTQRVPQWKPLEINRTAQSTTVRFVPLVPHSQQARVELLNAARVHRLAARTRSHLATRGWREISIGDAPSVREQSVVLYPAKERANAQKLAAHFGFALSERSVARRITILLGRDSVRHLASPEG